MAYYTDLPEFVTTTGTSLMAQAYADEIDKAHMTWASV